MVAALTILLILIVSMTVVRVASVAMRLTGLPDSVARFQCVSALTGTGFTTRESEMIVNYPIRRRILTTLMIFGNLGLVSVAATFIVAFVASDNTANAMLTQALAIAVAIGAIVIIMTNRTLDHILCRAVSRVLKSATSLGRRRFNRLLTLENGYSVTEHIYAGDPANTVEDLLLDDYPLTLLMVRTGDARDARQAVPSLRLDPGDLLVCYGSDEAHDAFEDELDKMRRAVAVIA